MPNSGGLIEFHSAKLTVSKGGSVEFDLTKLSKGLNIYIINFNQFKVVKL